MADLQSRTVACRYRKVQIGGDQDQNKAARAGVLALGAALAARRQHPAAEELWRAAMRRAAAALALAATSAPLVLRLRAGAVQLAGDDEPLLPFRPHEAPFGLLRGAGIGELRLRAGIEASDCEQFVEHLCGVVPAQLLAAEQLPGVALRALDDLPNGAADPREAWRMLPPSAAAAASPALRAIVQRDDTCNLPALAVRQLLDDCEHLGTAPDGLLENLLRRVLAQDDVATVTWLLTECQRQATFDQPIVQRLTMLARAKCDDAWLRERLRRDTPEQLMQLSALVMQLGPDVAERFAAAAADTAHPLTQWLGELLR